MTALHETQECDKNEYVFTSESVSEGHPDKVCDQISDAILDAYLQRNPKSRVACETLATTDTVVLAGEINSPGAGDIDVDGIVRDVIKGIGYTQEGSGFDTNCKIFNYLHAQTSELTKNADTEGAGDQGLMFGYACNQTKHLMPVPIAMAHMLMQKLAEARKSGTIPYLLPDSKSQVSFNYCGRKPVSLHTVVISTNHMHLSENQLNELRQMIMQLVVKPTVEEMESDASSTFSAEKYDTVIIKTPWEQGGPAGDTGLTGRKIIVDTYGGWAQHGGGAFSGKDPSKVDRSAAYMSRHIAKSVVGSGLADECLLQMGFVIGDTRPVSLMIDTFGSGKTKDGEIEKLVRSSFDLTVKGMIDYLELQRPIYLPTAAYGHFGRDNADFTWERIEKLS